MEVLKLEDARKERGSRVRAFLHADGTGSVQLVDRHCFVEQRSERVTCFLDDLGYTGHVGPASAKFWYENGLGKLAVFPSQLSMLAVDEVIKTKPSTWKKSSGQLALFIPCGPLGRSNEKTRQTFGSKRAKSIFRGGGPFVLKDSRDLALQALRQLGYLDEQNADEFEAMLCFVNEPNNKHHLRKLDLLPRRSDCTRDVKEKLRAAFREDAHPTWWHRQTTSAARVKQIVELLRQAGVLSKKPKPAGQYCSGYSQNDISQALSIYAREQQLPACKTFNCLAWRICARMNSEDPHRRGTVEFRRWALAACRPDISCRSGSAATTAAPLQTFRLLH